MCMSSSCVVLIFFHAWPLCSEMVSIHTAVRVVYLCGSLTCECISHALYTKLLHSHMSVSHMHFTLNYFTHMWVYLTCTVHSTTSLTCECISHALYTKLLHSHVSLSHKHCTLNHFTFMLHKHPCHWSQRQWLTSHIISHMHTILKYSTFMLHKHPCHWANASEHMTDKPSMFMCNLLLPRIAALAACTSRVQAQCDFQISHLPLP